MQEDIHIVLAIPGDWTDRAELIAALARQGRFLFAGDMITDLQTQISYSFDIHDRDEKTAAMIAYASQNSLRREDMARLQRHSLLIYLIGPGGSQRAARDMLGAAAKLTEIGGIAVQVVSSGAAHSAAYWQLMASHRDKAAALFDAYVTFAEQDGRFFSLGMQVLGLPDALVEGVAPDQAGELLQTFLLFTLLENPDLKDGQAFRVDPQSPAYRITYGPSDLQEPDNLMYNPFGVWRMEQLSA